jgi:hypothetical protein
MHALWDKYKGWISIINCMLLVAGVLGFWRDKIVVNEARVEQQSVTLGEIKGSVQVLLDGSSKTQTAIELLKQDNVSLKESQARVEHAQERSNQDLLDLTGRVSVLEQRKR